MADPLFPVGSFRPSGGPSELPSPLLKQRFARVKVSPRQSPDRVQLGHLLGDVPAGREGAALTDGSGGGDDLADVGEDPGKVRQMGPIEGEWTGIGSGDSDGRKGSRFVRFAFETGMGVLLLHHASWGG
jgi:hypothetical protein